MDLVIESKHKKREEEWHSARIPPPDVCTYI